jgi:cell wall-active antibiotic response 4TMS protein YvqF
MIFKVTGGRERKRLVWGVILITAGVILLLGQLGFSGIIPPLHWWPSILFVIGAAQVFSADRPKVVASGVSMMLLSLWFFACIYHWYGLTYRNGWPLLLVIFGGEILLASLLCRWFPAVDHPKGESHV